MKEDTSTRDSLAKHRTHLSNERTLLAYWRTALAFFLAGAVLIRLDHSSQSVLFAWVLIAIGALLFFYGIYRFVRYRKKVKNH